MQGSCKSSWDILPYREKTLHRAIARNLSPLPPMLLAVQYDVQNIETEKGGLNVLLWQICNLRTIEVSKDIFGIKCLNIFTTDCSFGFACDQLSNCNEPFDLISSVNLR